MKRYLVFVGDRYCPLGGFYDFLVDVASLELAHEELLKRYGKITNSYGWSQIWYHIVDVETLEMVEQGALNSQK